MRRPGWLSSRGWAKDFDLTCLSNRGWRTPPIGGSLHTLQFFADSAHRDVTLTMRRYIRVRGAAGSQVDIWHISSCCQTIPGLLLATATHSCLVNKHTRVLFPYSELRICKTPRIPGAVGASICRPAGLYFPSYNEVPHRQANHKSRFRVHDQLLRCIRCIPLLDNGHGAGCRVCYTHSLRGDVVGKATVISNFTYL